MIVLDHNLNKIVIEVVIPAKPAEESKD